MRDVGPRFLTPPEVSRRFGVNPSKVLQWIRSGELRAIDVSTHPGTGRPRFRISEVDLAVFEARRAAGPVAKTSRRRKRDAAVTEYF